MDNTTRKANPNQPLFARRNPDGSIQYYQITNTPSPSSIPCRPLINSQQPRISTSNSPVSTSTTRVNPVSNHLIFYINQQKHVVQDIDPRTTLNDYIRSCYGLTGTKKMCGEVIKYFHLIFFFFIYLFYF